MIRAKFICTAVKKRQHWDKSKGFIYDAEFLPVTSGSEENKAFFEATPAGNITLSSIRCEQFEPGKEYYLDFTLAN